MAGALFGTSAIFIRLLPGMNSFAIGFYRLALASLFLTMISLVFFRNDLLVTLRTRLWSASILGLIIGGHFAAYIDSVKHTSVINSTVLTNTTPIFASLLSTIFLGVRASTVAGLGMLISMMGMVVVFWRPGLEGSGLIGDLEALASAVLWAVYLVVGKRLRAGVNPFTVMIPVYASSSILLSAMSLAAGGLRPPLNDEIPAILGLALFPTTLGHTLSFSSLRGLQPYQTAILSMLEPAVASLLAAVVLGEIPTANSVIGSIIIFAGIYLVVSRER